MPSSYDLVREALRRRRLAGAAIGSAHVARKFGAKSAQIITATSGAGLVLLACAAAATAASSVPSQDENDDTAERIQERRSAMLLNNVLLSSLTEHKMKLPSVTHPIIQRGNTCQCESAVSVSLPDPPRAGGFFSSLRGNASSAEPSSPAAPAPTTRKSQTRRRTNTRSMPSPVARDLTRRLTLRRMTSQATEQTVEELYAVDPDPLGQGSYGEVYQAYEKMSGQGVALKRISKEFTDDLDFQREMNALLHIRACGGHPNICQLRENFEETDDFILILDLIRGGEMFDFLIDHGAYSEFEAARLIREVGGALQFLHGIGIVHCDLKPENLMLSSKNKDEATIKIVDFGCAEIVPEVWGEGPPLDGGDGSDDTVIQIALLQPARTIRPGRAGGTTSAYCPPESFDTEEGSPIAPSMDMWSLGIILYIMLTGLHPFDIDSNLSDEEIEAHIKKQRTPPLDAPHTAHLSSSAIDLLSKLMHPDPNKRLTAHDMLNHPWVRGETARRDAIEGSAEKLSKLRRFQSNLEAKVFHNLINWSDDDGRLDPSQQGTSLLQKAFSTMDEHGKGFVTMDDVARYVGHTVTDEEGNEEASGDSSIDSMNLSGFSDLVGEHMQSRYFPRGHVVFHEGDPGDYMYFINSGTVEVSTKNGFRAKLGQGDSFGEGSLLHPGATRSATLRCATPVHVIQVDKEYFKKYLSSADTKMALRLREKVNTRSFGRVEFILSEQPDLEEVQYEQGDILFNIGDEADDLYVVDGGKIDIRGPKGNKAYEMKAGDVFGLQSLVLDRPRKASATCSSKEGCRCRKLDYHRFNQLLHKHKELKKAIHHMCYRREFKRAVVLRSRKSFPVEDQLRAAFDELDTDGSGDLTMAEIGDLLTHLDQNLTEEQQKELIDSMNLSSTGRIDFEEFASVFGKM